MKRPFAHGLILLLVSLLTLSASAFADSPKLRVEVMDATDVLVILAPDGGAEPTEILSDLPKLENVLKSKIWRRDSVEVIMGKKFEGKTDVVTSLEKLFLDNGAERIIFYKAKGNFIVGGEKLPVLKDVKSPKKK